MGKKLHSIRRKLETYKVRIYQSNVHCLKQQQKNLTYDQYILITVRVGFMCHGYLEICLIQIIQCDKRVIHLICIISRGCLATFGSIGSKRMDVYPFASLKTILDHYFTKSELIKSSFSGLMNFNENY